MMPSYTIAHIVSEPRVSLVPAADLHAEVVAWIQKYIFTQIQLKTDAFQNSFLWIFAIRIKHFHATRASLMIRRHEEKQRQGRHAKRVALINVEFAKDFRYNPDLNS